MLHSSAIHNNKPKLMKYFQLSQELKLAPSLGMYSPLIDYFSRQGDTEALTKWVKGLDPSRLVNDASGWHDRHCGDVIDMHRYPGPGSPAPEPARAAVLGEFGGLGLAIPDHIWTPKSWGYKGMASREALTKNYVDLWRRVHQLKEDAGLSAAVYTQWTDVEAECNGLLTYDRKVVKVDAEQARAAHRGMGTQVK